MSLASLTIQQFRNIHDAELSLNPGLTLICGENGSGKTSILEAIHYLSTAKSFRTRNLAPLIEKGYESFTIAADITQTATKHRIGIRRSSNRLIRRIDNINVQSQVEFSKLLPVRILHPDSHLLITSGPGLRRRFLDWGCFYFDEQFYQHWHAAHSLLKQRNALLKTSRSSDVTLIKSFDDQFAAHASVLQQVRKSYLTALLPIANQLSQGVIKDFDRLTLDFNPGWKEGLNLQQVLHDSLINDQRYKRTHYGPHRADFTVQMNNEDVRNTASRGQQKLIAFVLVLSQLSLFQQHNPHPALLMIDDLASELDWDHQAGFLGIINDLEHQVIITSISDSIAELTDWGGRQKMFHVKHGEIQEVI